MTANADVYSKYFDCLDKHEIVEIRNIDSEFKNSKAIEVLIAVVDGQKQFYHTLIYIVRIDSNYQLQFDLKVGDGFYLYNIDVDIGILSRMRKLDDIITRRAREKDRAIRDRAYKRGQVIFNEN